MAVFPDLAQPPGLAGLRSGRPVALFLDFDGTLVEIAPTPDAIVVPPGLAGQLERLDAALGGRLALVSGRALDNIAQHLGSPAIARAGSHGASCLLADGTRLGAEPQALPAVVLDSLAAFCGDHELEFERKQHGAAIHYRSSPELEARARGFATGLAEEHALATKFGKCVVELVRPGAGKAGAVQAFMAQAPFTGALPVFVGDDVTDEDGFRAVAELGGFGIKVGEGSETLAQYGLQSVAEVHAWLEL